MWQVTAVVDPTVTEDSQNLTAWATCYNPRGAVRTQTTALYTPASIAKAAVTPRLLTVASAERSAR